ncbi:MAG TPA: DUF397 domain-containing protein [Mycobacteriales bacterium]|nr:DUF397 domain-containing protein [Mycobacteriales bacterium]
MENTGRIQWRKSSACLGGSQCVEVAAFPSGSVGVRDSKNPAGPALEFTAGQWGEFLGGLRQQEVRR